MWSHTKVSWNWNARYGFVFALSKIGIGLSGRRLPHTIPWVPKRKVQRSSQYWCARAWDPCAGTESGTQGMVWGSRRPNVPMPILLSANRNPYWAFQFQESLVWDHQDAQYEDSKRAGEKNSSYYIQSNAWMIEWIGLMALTVNHQRLSRVAHLWIVVLNFENKLDLFT